MLDDSRHFFSTHTSLRNIIIAMRTNAILCGLIGLWVIADSLVHKSDLHSLIIGFGCLLMIAMVEHKITTLTRSNRPTMYSPVAACGLFIPIIFTMLGILELVS